MKFEKDFTYITEWSSEDDCFISRVLEFPLQSLSAFGDTKEESISELKIVLLETIQWLEDEEKSICNSNFYI